MKAIWRPVLAIALFAQGCLPGGPAAAQSNEIEVLSRRVAELSAAKNYAEAIPLAERLLQARERRLGRDHPDVIETLLILGRLNRAQGRHAEADAFEKRADQMRRAASQTAEQSRRENQEAARRAEETRRMTEALRRAEEQAARQQQARRQQQAERRAPEAAPRQQQPSPPLTRSIPQPRSDVISPGAAGTQALPFFPWPPPTASASYVLPRNLFQAQATFGDVADAIVTALERTGYVERSFFGTPDDGIALVTRLERINDDGTARAGNDRWPAAFNQSAADLAGYVKGLFFVERGRYRVIVFVLQARPFVQSPERVTGAEAREWLRRGANVLPPELAQRRYGDGACSVLIYEFESEGRDKVAKIVDSHLTGRQHLEKAGVLRHLGRAN
ncbi:MAG TPA: tetratricopeptide repeat protein [Xanthobacteraceae bacterium]|nr:tetratricopeptide repeat protein [Xanthobacteraceae bacterium]